MPEPCTQPSHKQQCYGNRCKDGRIERPRSIEHRADQPSRAHAGCKTKCKPEKRRPQTSSSTCHSTCSRCAPNAMRMPISLVRWATIWKARQTAHAGKQQRERRKGREQSRVEAGVERGLTEQLIHRQHIGDGQVVVQFLDNALHRESQLLHIMTGADNQVPLFSTPAPSNSG